LAALPAQNSVTFDPPRKDPATMTVSLARVGDDTQCTTGADVLPGLRATAPGMHVTNNAHKQARKGIQRRLSHFFVKVRSKFFC